MRDLQRLPLIKSACFLLVALSAAASYAEQNGMNGAYGGYVGSDRWFNAMRQSASNRSMLESLQGKKNDSGIPAGYVELLGQITFPQGDNPFHGKRWPDIRIKPRDVKADPVTRAPRVDAKGCFYTVLKRGQTYDVYWMYYFGSKEKFATIHVDSNGPEKRKVTMEYMAMARRNSETGKEGNAGPSDQEPQARQGYQPPKVGPGYKAPAVGVGYHPPQRGPAYQAPVVGEGYQPPQAGPGYQAPGSRQ